MVANMKRLWQLWGIYAKMDLLWFLRDTKYCVACIVADITSSLASILGVYLLAERFGNIGGMNTDQVLFMLGYACTVDGVISMFFSMNNVAWISRLIGRGQLDHRLIQPVPLWMQLASEGFLPISGNSTLLCGITITMAAISRLTLAVDGLWIGGFLFSLLCSVAVILSCSYIAGSVAFYAPVAGEEISTTAIGLFGALKTFPIGGLALVTRAMLCTVVPVGLAAWFPANVLLGQTPSDMPGVLLLMVTITLAFIATKLFKRGMKHYAKRGSIRYHDRGHRS